jgi:hypothetical protein
MELQGDAAQVESCFRPFRDGVSVRARKVHDLCQTYHRVRLEMALILTPDRYIVYAKCTICLEIVFEAPDGTPR